MKTALAVLMCLAFSLSARGVAAQTALPPAAQAVDIDEHLGATLPGDPRLVDSSGEAFRVADVLRGDKPVILVMAYYRCPMLCGLVLKGLVDSLTKLDFRLGRDYRALTISFDPKDTPEAAAQKKASALAALNLPAASPDWRFAVADEGSARRIADTLGFRYAYDPATDQYAHPAAVFVLTPDGRIARYLYGVTYGPRDVRLALMEASRGKIGSIVDRVLVTCYRYDPAGRRYEASILGFFRIGSALILAVVAGSLALLWRADRARRRCDRAGRA